MHARTHAHTRGRGQSPEPGLRLRGWFANGRAHTFHKVLEGGSLVALVLERTVANFDELRAEAAARVRPWGDHRVADQLEARAENQRADRWRRCHLHPVLEGDAALEAGPGRWRGNRNPTHGRAKVVHPLQPCVLLWHIIILQATADHIDHVRHIKIRRGLHVVFVGIDMVHPRRAVPPATHRGRQSQRVPAGRQQKRQRQRQPTHHNHTAWTSRSVTSRAEVKRRKQGLAKRKTAAQIRLLGLDSNL